MAKPKGQGKGAGKSRAKPKGKLAKALKPFASAFALCALVVAVVLAFVWAQGVPGWRVTLTWYPLLAIAALALVAVAYWRAGRPGVVGALFALAAGGAAVVAFQQGWLPERL